jgi:hypothetical protein
VPVAHDVLVEIENAFVHIFDELINAEVVLFIVFNCLLLHALVDLVQMLKVSYHFAFIVGIVVVKLYI